MATKKGGKRRVITVDFEGVESGGKIVPDGTYNAVIHAIEEKESSNDNPMLAIKWKILSGKGKGTLVWDNVSLTPQALWKLKTLCESLDIEVPDSSYDIDLDTDLVGQEATIEITNEKYEGKDRPRVTGYGSVEDKADAPEKDEDEDEDEKEEKKDERVGRSKPSKKPVKDEDEDEDEDEDGDEDEKPAPKAKFKEGQKVSFKDSDGKTVKGVIIEVTGKSCKVEDKAGDEWEIFLKELTAL